MPTPPAPNTFVPDEVIGRYKILQLVSVGYFAQVYFAQDIELGRHVVLRFNRNLEATPELDAQLLNASRILADLQHPSLLTVFDIGRFEELPYIVCEFAPSSFAKEIAEGKFLHKFERIVDSLTQVAEGLDYVHRRGYIHRNLNPKTILLDIHGTPKLASFELAVPKDRVLSEIAGTPPYMSPDRTGNETHFFHVRFPESRSGV